MLDLNCYVYIHVNKINKKMYVGQTTQKPEYRWNQGKGYFRSGYGEIHTPFAEAIREYGWDNFDHYVIPCLKEEMDIIETQLIDLYKTNNPKYGYNCDSGGIKGFNRSVDTKYKIKIANRHKRIRKHVCGKHLSEEVKDKIRKANIGSNSVLSKTVLQCDLNNNIIKEWGSTREIERHLGFLHQTIAQACRSKSHISHGYIWRYK